MGSQCTVSPGNPRSKVLNHTRNLRRLHFCPSSSRLTYPERSEKKTFHLDLFDGIELLLKLAKERKNSAEETS